MHTYPIRSSLRVLLVLAAVSAVSSPGMSAPPVPADPAPEPYLLLFERGKALNEKGRYREAYDAQLAAWALHPSYDIASNLGSVELTLGMARDAAEHFAYAIATFPAKPTTVQKQQLVKVKELLKRARKHVGALVLKVSVKDAEVLVDGKSIGHAPFDHEVYVDPGARVVEAKLGGYQSATRSVQVTNGPAQEVTLTMVEIPPPPPPIVVVRDPDVGAPAATATATATGTAVEPPPPPTQKGPSTAVLVSGGALTGVALVMGTAFALVSNGKASDAVAKRDALVKSNGSAACTGASVPVYCAEVSDAIGGKNTYGTAAAWSFIGAGAVGAATLIYALATPKATKSARIVIAPRIAVRGGGIEIGGAW